jgi:hypothetical protein
MNKDWKLIARASGFPIPYASLDRIAPGLDALEAEIRQLACALPASAEPAVAFHADESEAEKPR